MLKWFYKINNKVRCFWGYHKYVFIRDLSTQVALLKCEACGEKFALHKELTAIIPFNQEVQDFYELGLKKYLKKYNNK